MKAKRDGIPMPVASEDRASYAQAVCTVCRGILDISVPNFVTVVVRGREVQLSGVTIYRCSRCGTVETPSMRKAAQPMLKDAAPKCAYDGCTNTVRSAIRTTLGPKQRYCAPYCRDKARREKHKAEVMAQRSEAA